ncbi:hypothetical protein GPECTOR_30g270 [Gonium pectorale]|uniref:MalT-like TPR region domain-containing protein n=1 Tax=Gonium pectorale TaxID=33097 RepID=A0A150GEB6_GONPE|nr:hypothetical protein GPECTOR_30g270 [Gonium pectorale]|eukprot:KXZ48174.1 hypothetical protein GPECTOR_30g270 [Gonium pectorale]
MSRRVSQAQDSVMMPEMAPRAAAARSFATSSAASSAAAAGGDAQDGSGTGGTGSGPGSSPGGPGSGPGEARMSLGEALNRLVDAAIEKVESGSLDEAVSLLKEGLTTFEPLFPNSPELGELHNQAALLLLFQNKPEEAAHHAEVSLEATRRHFGSSSVLTAHRLLRLGVARFAQGKMADAAGLLREAYGILGGEAATSSSSAAAAADPGSRSEAGFYLDAVALAHVRDAGGVEALSGSLRDNVRGLKEAYGADSMILSLALAQHSRLVHGGLEQADFGVGEALLKQQIALLGEVSGPDSEDAAVARYKLATYYYANDMLVDAGGAVRQAAAALRAMYPDDHDMLVLCRHRLGMICAAQGDHRAATQLLQGSRKHFSGEGGQGMLAKEADIGLAMARFRAVDPVRESTARRLQLQQEALEALHKEIEALAESIGHGHMLVQGATRYYGQLSKIAR